MVSTLRPLTNNSIFIDPFCPLNDNVSLEEEASIAASAQIAESVLVAVDSPEDVVKVEAIFTGRIRG